MTANAFPESGISREDVLASLKKQRSSDLKTDGRAFAFIYDAGEAERELAREAFAACMSINGLDPTTYPSARTIENHVVSACLEILSAPEGAVGTATAGGTESVMLAVKSARDYFASKGGPRAEAPAMLLPQTAHACFHKAAQYFGIEVITVDVDPVTFQADLADARAKMRENVVLVVGSAPSYAHGVIDPIEGLAALAAENDALMHVDSCVGGCVLPFLRELGVDLPAFDFALEGVTSISVDLHKYGFAPKGISVLLQRRRELRDAQYFACANWTGYTIVNATTLGSKSVAAMGAAYALIHNLGRQGYRERAELMWNATKRMVAAIGEIPGLAVLASPQMNLFSFVTTELDGKTADIFELADRLAARGWHVQPTYAFGPSPAHIHLTIDPNNAVRVEEFVADLEDALSQTSPTQEPPAAIVGMLATMVEGDGQAIAPSTLMTQLGVRDGKLPADSAPIHRLLNAASPAIRERLLVLFVGELFL